MHYPLKWKDQRGGDDHLKIQEKLLDEWKRKKLKEKGS